ncbi:hypothetical protein J6590_059262 [Homalodisca vitripennis]|nr:hypothetical protein J6590_059262 [Homalodisca vitripennis]
MPRAAAAETSELSVDLSPVAPRRRPAHTAATVVHGGGRRRDADGRLEAATADALSTLPAPTHPVRYPRVIRRHCTDYPVQSI